MEKKLTFSTFSTFQTFLLVEMVSESWNQIVEEIQKVNEAMKLGSSLSNARA